MILYKQRQQKAVKESEVKMKIKNTFRLDKRLDNVITQKSEELGMSKNAYVQMILCQALRVRLKNSCN